MTRRTLLAAGAGLALIVVGWLAQGQPADIEWNGPAVCTTDTDCLEQHPNMVEPGEEPALPRCGDVDLSGWTPADGQVCLAEDDEGWTNR